MGAREPAWTDPADDQIGLAAETQAEGGVEERGGEREGDGDHAEHRKDQEPDQPHEGEAEPDLLREPQRPDVLQLAGRAEPRTDESSVQLTVRRRRWADEGADGEDGDL